MVGLTLADRDIMLSWLLDSVRKTLCSAAQQLMVALAGPHKIERTHGSLYHTLGSHGLWVWELMTQS
jgi:hypothetical protein